MEHKKTLEAETVAMVAVQDNRCTGCTGLVDALGDLSLLKNRDTTFVVVSRAPLAKLDAYKAQLESDSQLESTSSVKTA